MVTNPLTPDESVLRRSLLPGLLRALAFNADRRQGQLRLFEVGHVFPPPDGGRVRDASRRAGAQGAPGPTVVDERELLAVVFAAPGDDARRAAAAWQTLREALAVDVAMVAPTGADDVPSGLHPTRCARLVAAGGGGGATVGEVGEVDSEVLARFGLGPRSGREPERVGWLQVDLGLLTGSTPRRRSVVTAVSPFPSSDVDLAFVVADSVPAAAVESTLRSAAGSLLERLALFDIYRGPGIDTGSRSLAYTLRFCAPDRTLTGEEVAALRAECISAVEATHGARLRT